MSASTTCFENIIGLSRTDCPCVEDRPVDAGVSESGLYLDELEGLNLRLINASQACGYNGIWAKMERARESAIEQTIEELMACIGANTDPARGIGKAQIGEDKKATAASHLLRHAFHGMTIQTAKVQGGAFYVDAIGTSFKPTDGMGDTIVLNVYEREEASSDPIATYVLPITGNKTVWTDIEPLSLSMDAMGMENPRFWFLFSPVAGMKAMNAEINCGCSSTGQNPYWDLNAPQYLSRQQKGQMLWAEWAMAAGTFGTTLADRDTWTTENPTSGILLRVRFECDEQSTFCAGSPNYQTDHIQKVLAHTVRFKAGANLVKEILSSTDINPYTMTGGDQLEQNRKEYLDAFNKRIGQYLCPELSNSANVNRYGDCRKCKDRHGLRRSPLKN